MWALVMRVKLPGRKVTCTTCTDEGDVLAITDVDENGAAGVAIV